MSNSAGERPTDAAISAVAVGSIVPIGRFSYDADTDSWWWSDEMYRIHGFDPGQVTPSTDLLVAQRYPTDRRRSVELLARALARADSFSTRYRIVDAHARTRTVLSAAAFADRRRRPRTGHRIRCGSDDVAAARLRSAARNSFCGKPYRR